MHGQMKRRHVYSPTQQDLYGGQDDDLLGDSLGSSDNSIAGVSNSGQPYGTGTFLMGPLAFAVTHTVAPSAIEPSQPAYSAPWASESLTPPGTERSGSDYVKGTSTSQPLSTTRADELEPESPTSNAAHQKAGTLPSGAVIGLVMAAMTISISLLIYFVRRRYVQRRIRLRKEWTRSKAMRPSQPDSRPPFNERQAWASPSTPVSPFVPRPKTPSNAATSTSPFTGSAPSHNPPMASRGPPSATATRPGLAPLTIPVPPSASYGTEYSAGSSNRMSDPYPVMAPTPEAKKLTTPEKKLLTPIYGPAAAGLSKPVSATVVSTFITTLPDELHITVGEKVRVISEFDDGWATCLNGAGEGGMVPLECLDKGRTGHGRHTTLGVDVAGRTLGGRAKRISSLNPEVTGIRRF